jgi:hypothetical protein
MVGDLGCTNRRGRTCEYRELDEPNWLGVHLRLKFFRFEKQSVLDQSFGSRLPGGSGSRDLDKNLNQNLDEDLYRGSESAA